MVFISILMLVFIQWSTGEEDGYQGLQYCRSKPELLCTMSNTVHQYFHIHTQCIQQCTMSNTFTFNMLPHTYDLCIYIHLQFI